MVNIAEQTSLAQRLASSGCPSASMGVTITEFVLSCIGGATAIDVALLERLQTKTNFQAWRILQDQPIWESRPANLQSWELQQLVPEIKKAA